MRRLGWVGIGCFVLAFVVSGYFLVQLLGAIPGTPTRVGNGPVRLDDVGLTVFATKRDALQTCTAKDASGAVIDLQEPSRSEKFDDAGRTFYVVAHSVVEIPAQTVDVTCTDRRTTYYVGNRHTAGTFMVLALKAVISFFTPAAIGATLIVIDQLSHRRRERSRAEDTASDGG